MKTNDMKQKIHTTKMLSALFLTAVFLALPAKAQVNLQQGLVAYYPFNGNANDESGNGNHGTIYGATFTVNTPSDKGYALSFDGINDFVQFSSPVINTPPYSISVWVNISSFPSLTSYILSNGGQTGVSYGFYIMLTILNRWEFGTKYQGSNLWQKIRSPASTGDWYFLVGIWDGLSGTDHVRFYVNGILIGNYSNRTHPVGQANNLRMGAPSNALNYFFHGIIDEVSIYNRVLNEDEIYTLYMEGQPPQTNTITNILINPRIDGSGLVDVYFNLNGTAGLYNMALQASFDDGSTYVSIPQEYLSGDTYAVEPGINKHIVWDGLGSFPNTYSTGAKLKIIANPD